MIAVIQRVNQASVKINEKVRGVINLGFLIFLGITHDDSKEDIEWLTKKLVNLRVFGDEEVKMNLSVKDVDGEILIISQFTLHASTKKGNRPSFVHAARPEVAIPLYESFIKNMEEELGKKVETGEFGADMKVSLVNDGPVTIIIDSKDRK